MARYCSCCCCCHSRGRITLFEVIFIFSPRGKRTSLHKFYFFCSATKCTRWITSLNALHQHELSLSLSLSLSLNLFLSLSNTLALTHMHARMHSLTRVHPHALSPIYSNVGECDSNVSIHFLASASEKSCFRFLFFSLLLPPSGCCVFPDLALKGLGCKRIKWLIVWRHTYVTDCVTFASPARN